MDSIWPWLNMPLFGADQPQAAGQTPATPNFWNSMPANNQPTYTASDAVGRLLSTLQRGMAGYQQQLQQAGIDPMSLSSVAQNWEKMPGMSAAQGFGPGLAGSIEAAVPAARGLALSMDQASRMARAQEMGFRPSMPLYHGSNATFDAFKSVPTTQPGLAAPGVSAALDPAVASEFAASRAATRGGQPQVYPLLHRADNPAVLDLAGNESHGEVAGALRDAFDAGHDAVMIRNYTTPGGVGEQKIVIVRDANQLRSPNAAFDPANKLSANLLAGVGAGAVSLPLFSPRPEINQGK